MRAALEKRSLNATFGAAVSNLYIFVYFQDDSKFWDTVRDRATCAETCAMVIKDKLAIKENFDDDDLSDDVDDEVFVRDGKKSILKMEKHNGDERPLMPMRRKSKAKTAGSSPEVRSRQPCNIYNCLLPVYFAIAAVISIGCEYTYLV